MKRQMLLSCLKKKRKEKDKSTHKMFKNITMFFIEIFKLQFRERQFEIRRVKSHKDRGVRKGYSDIIGEI